MNKARRKMIEEVIAGLEDLIGQAEAIRDEEQEALENIPESLRGSERYEQSEAAVSALEDAISSMEEASCSIEESME